MSFRLALRTLRRAPWFAVTAIGTIALTIGLAATVFAIVDGVLFKALPYPDSARLFDVVGSSGRPGEGTASLASSDVSYLAAADERIGITAFGASSVTLLSRPDLTFWAATIDEHFFEVLGMQPLIGGFNADHYGGRSTATGLRPAIVSHAFWQQWLGAESGAIGKSVPVTGGGAGLLIVGILPRDFVFPNASGRTRPDILFPRVIPAVAEDRWNRSLSAVMRLRNEIRLDEALSRLGAALAAHVDEYRPQQAFPGPYAAVVLRPLQTQLGRVERPLFRLAFAGSALLILLGAINVAGLLAARTHDRLREMTIRIALGARRKQVAAVVLAEALIVALAGSLLGLGFALLLLSVALSSLPESVLLLKEPAIDWRVVTFAITSSCGVVGILALFPAISASSRSLHARASIGSAVTASRFRTRSLVVVTESAIGIALVVAGSLLLASYVTLRAEDPGFETDRLGVLEVRMPDVVQPQELQARYERVLDRLRQVPGVDGAATIGVPLLENLFSGSVFRQPPGPGRFFASDIPVSGSFFEVAGIALLDGRYPSQRELDTGQPNVVVSDATARAYWPGTRAVGQTLTSADRSVTVVGVVEEARIGAYDDSGGGEIYVPVTMARNAARTFLVRTSNRPGRVMREAAVAVRRDVPEVLLRRAESFDAAVSRSIRLQRFRTIVFTTSAVAGLVLLAVGIAGMAATGVAQRSREIGIRSALGAPARKLIAMIVFDHLRPAAVGVGLGLLLSFWTTRLLSSFVYRVDTHEPALWFAAVVGVLGVGTVAAWVPATRASRVDPMVVLKAE